ncbi:MAG: DUF4263 domain-containing protein [Candidatus Marinimicrobia bacterium]|jgi:hypothetical protein|nr:DUF4263 domain-containing protein [Candidatus Neomarinimicrobiota bacterium]
MGEIRKSKKGIDYIPIKILLDKPRVVTKAMLEKIPHDSKDDEICLKIGRYKKEKGEYGQIIEILETNNPKSELTLTGIEFTTLISYLQDNYTPLKEGIKKFISIDDSFSKENINYLKTLFSQPEKQKVVNLIFEKDILSEEVLIGIEYATRIKAIDEFKTMLAQNLREIDWQKWFQKNNWILGSEFVKIIGERSIDTKNIADFLMQAYDGFLDIIEIKRPNIKIPFWSENKDHDNYYPSRQLIQAITQSNNYLYEVERESNSQKFLDQVEGVKTVKPRCVLIFGRSNNWNKEQKESYRLLNSSYHSLSIMTYDHVLERASRIIEIQNPRNPLKEKNKNNSSLQETDKYDDAPF